MSNPDAAAGPYAGNEKKPIGGNIMAHASTTRLALRAHVCDKCGLLAHIDFSSRKAAAPHEPARYTTRRACPRWRRSLLSFKAASETPRKKPNVLNLGQTPLSFVIRLLAIVES
ncbi:Rad51-domain-containing protein [Pleurotus eryngii]|uniref:Rad51-domain-containing protein n=1 Tax=Pleurotus eryngii TaxID=5323 RepID=A0A9P5ZZW0_PLEER|nr:Rad51-domain-containing protein [Pleurotus eryngii]